MNRIGRFEVLQPIGEGAMAAVDLALDAPYRPVPSLPCPGRRLSRR